MFDFVGRTIALETPEAISIYLLQKPIKYCQASLKLLVSPLRLVLSMWRRAARRKTRIAARIFNEEFLNE